MYFCCKVIIVYYKFVYLRTFLFELSDDTALFELIQLVPPGTVLYFDKVIDMRTHFMKCFYFFFNFFSFFLIYFYYLEANYNAF